MDVSRYDHLKGEYVDWHIKPDFVIVSLLVSLLGTWTTVELLHRRTAGRGWYNSVLLVGACITMGGIATWSMHFIGNRAIILNEGQKELEVEYNDKWTAASFALPISVTFLAFMVCGTNDNLTTTGLGARTFFGGAFAGIAICGMHYVGQMGITNYQWHVGTSYVAGSAIIAIVACIVALKVFFLLRANWTNSWWKRLTCALALALAVSGMHWVASLGTTYRFKHVVPYGAGRVSRDNTVYVVLAFCLLACIGLMGFAIKGHQDYQELKVRAQKVVLAAVTFDTEGRLLVTPEGTLPCQKITNSYIERSFDDVFSVAHPVFIWIYRTARNWPGIADLIPSMKIHLSATHFGRRPSKVRRTRFGDEVAAGEEDYSTIFRELFCVAAYELAGKLKERLENIGVLYEDIMMTGTTSYDERSRRLIHGSAESAIDIELGVARPEPIILGRGQLLFIVRRADPNQAARLKASGYRFATLDHVMDLLASSTQTSRKEIEPRIRNMLDYANNDPFLTPGVYLSCCAIRARPHGRWEILTRKNKPAQLPSIPLCSQWTRMHKSILSTMDGWTLNTCLRWLSLKKEFKSATEKDFVCKLYHAMEYLAATIAEPWINDAVLTASAIAAPCSSQDSFMANAIASPCGSPLPSALVIVFRKLVDCHSRASSSEMMFSPLNFFRAQQRTYSGCRDHAIFSRDNHVEFEHFLPRKSSLTSITPSLPSPVTISSSRTGSRPQVSRSWSWMSRERESRGMMADVAEEETPVKNVIVVRNDVSVDVSKIGKKGVLEDEMELEEVKLGDECGVMGEEEPTYVDELFKMLVEQR
ncbi:MAG: hypothetical protein M1835_001476 [Candelina submexicana]|nr:MAG: hypothetical protein M1835_001476 [Candelina submexicana]